MYDDDDDDVATGLYEHKCPISVRGSLSNCAFIFYSRSPKDQSTLACT